MTIDEAIIKKDTLSLEMSRLIAEFESETGLYVKYVELYRDENVWTAVGGEKNVSVGLLDIDLKIDI